MVRASVCGPESAACNNHIQFSINISKSKRLMRGNIEKETDRNKEPSVSAADGKYAVYGLYLFKR